MNRYVTDLLEQGFVVEFTSREGEPGQGRVHVCRLSKGGSAPVDFSYGGIDFDDALGMAWKHHCLRGAMRNYGLEVDRLKREIERLETESMQRQHEAECLAVMYERAKKYRDYWDSLYAQGLEVVGWHLSGAPEPFDSFWESAEEIWEGG